MRTGPETASPKIAGAPPAVEAALDTVLPAGAPPHRGDAAGGIPAYLTETYAWAYLKPSSFLLFDHSAVVSLILWGNYGRLRRAAVAEIHAGQSLLQAACVYGGFSTELAMLVGRGGRMDVVDVAPIQVANCTHKLAGFPQAHVRVAAAAAPGGGPYDVVLCFFLLHEVPDADKFRIVDGLLGVLAPGGKAVFVDYHRPRRGHLLKGLTGLVFDTLEPFAKTLWHREISSFAANADEFGWRKETYFGDLYQKVVATRLDGT